MITTAIKRGVAAAGITGLVAAGAVVVALTTGASPAVADPAQIVQPSSSTVTADALPTVQMDGVAWAQVVVGNTVYVGGSFANARPAGAAAGTNLTPRANMLAYNITTGALVTSFAPTFNGQVRSLAVSPDGSRLYAGGDFTTVNGVGHNRIAAFDATSGALIAGFNGGTDAGVRAITATNTAVYVGGLFTHANGNNRGRLAAFTASTGALTAWAPSADYTVNALVMSPDKSRVIAGGAFANISGNSAYGLGAIDASTGSFIPSNFDSVVRNAGTQAAITSLSTDGTAILGTGYVFGAGGNFEGTFSADPATGTLNWMEDCHGDTYGAFGVNGVVYTVSHAHFCGNIGGWPVYDPWQFRHTLAFTANATGTLTHNSMGGYADFYNQPSPSMINWFPDYTTGKATGQNQAAWTVAGNSQYVVQGGEFPTVNGTPQQGLVRFAVRPIAPAKSGPMLTGGKFVPSLVSTANGTVRVSFRSNWDRDSKTLTYKVVRNSDTANPVWTTTADSQWWNTPTIGFYDTGLTPGATYRYRLYATDPDGNTVAGDTVTITLPVNGSSQTAYDKAVVADGASSYWTLNESSGATFIDNAGFNDLDSVGGITRGVTGPIAGTTATTFDGSSATSSTRTAITAPDVFSVSTWIRTTSTSGGKIVGFGGSQNTTSGNYDRHVYLDNSGRVQFGVYNNAVSTLSSPNPVNDGQWHQIVASLSPDGMALYVDGVRVARRTDVVYGQAYSGYWRVGGDNLDGWTNQPSSRFFGGDIADVAVFPTALSRSTVRDEYVASGRSVNTPAPPTDSYGKAVAADDPDLFWRLDDQSGPTAADASQNQAPGVYSGGVSYRTPSTVTGAGGTGVTFDGSSGTVASQQRVSNPTVYSEEAWFKTTTTHGGKIIGFGDQQSGYSGNYDRHVYMTNDGRLNFGTWTGQANLATTPGSYNDGVWHQMVATQGSDGMKLYLDGALVATNPQTQQQGYDGYWRVGGDSSWGGDSSFLDGSIDEVAVYSRVLTAAQVQAHYVASAQSPNVAPTASFTSSCSVATCTFDASASTDVDGSVASYAWDFGDGTTGTGASPSHTYGTSGTYPVTLTVTDNQGATGTVSHDVQATVPPPNQPPTAAFSSSTSDLKVSFDGSGSADTDGSVASYAWDFGDGTTGTGAKPDHTYATAGSFTVKLTVTDDKGATDSVTHPVVTNAPNQAPTASFTATATGLGVAFDGSASSDSDGTVASYAWDYGDGTSGTGAKPNHTYAAGGSYQVKLTVTDDDAASGFVTKTVTVTAPGPQVYAADTFTRTVSSGLGTAGTGGAWTLSGTSSLFSVNGTAGRIKIASAGSGPSAFLNSVSARDVDATVDVSADSTPTGGGTYAMLAVRHVGTTDYRVKAKLLPGSVTLYLSKFVSGTETTLATKVISGLTYTGGDVLRIRFDAVGSTSTDLTAKVWKVGATEPAAWQISASDTTPALQAAGGVGLQGYLATSATTAPVTVSFDNLAVGSVPTP